MKAITNKEGTILTLDNDGEHDIIKISKQCSSEQRAWLLSQFAQDEDMDNALQKMAELMRRKNPKIQIVEIQDEITFEQFWEAYNYKVGNKKRVMRRWQAMPLPERAKAIQHIRKYNFYLAHHPNIERKYPETYLNAEEWNN